jgi:hypothetical protein
MFELGQTVSGIRSPANRLVRREPEAARGRGRVRRLERAGVDAELGRVHAHAEHPVHPLRVRPPQLHQALDHLEPGIGAIGAVDVADEQAAGAGLGLGRRCALRQAGDDVGQVLSGGQVAGGCEERLAVDEAVGRAVDRRLVREPRPVGAVAEHALDDPEDLEERVEAGVAVHRRRVLVGQRDPVLLRQLGDGRRPHRALDVAVQLDLRELLEGGVERRETLLHRRAPGDRWPSEWWRRGGR